MNFIDAVTIAAPGKLQEFSVLMETPSLTAALAGSAAIVVLAADGGQRNDPAEAAPAVPPDHQSHRGPWEKQVGRSGGLSSRRLTESLAGSPPPQPAESIPCRRAGAAFLES
jgi:hypothetical protein